MKRWTRLNVPISSNISLHPTPKIPENSWIRLKWFAIQHLISNTISNVDFNVFERSNIYSNVFSNITRYNTITYGIHSVLSFTVRASWTVVKKKQTP